MFLFLYPALVKCELIHQLQVIVDIGTGYYIEKEASGAQEYFQRKVNFVTENMTRVQAIGNEKAKIRWVTDMFKLILILLKFL